jgi:hypothetical protein
MNKDEPIDEYDYYCSTCLSIVDQQDKFCRKCGADTSQTEEPDAERSDLIDGSKDSHLSTDVATPISEVSSDRTSSQLAGKQNPRPGLGSAAIILFVMAVFTFVDQVVYDHGQLGGTASSIPFIANVVIGIGLLRPQGFWNMSQNGYRIWAIIRCIATPILIAMEAPGTAEPPAFVVHSPEMLIATGLFTMLIGPPPSRKRIAFGLSLSVIGFIAAAILIGVAVT